MFSFISSSLPAVQSVQKQPLVAKPLPGGSIVPIKNLLPHPPAVSGRYLVINQHKADIQIESEDHAAGVIGYANITMGH